MSIATGYIVTPTGTALGTFYTFEVPALIPLEDSISTDIVTRQIGKGIWLVNACLIVASTDANTQYDKFEFLAEDNVAGGFVYKSDIIPATATDVIDSGNELSFGQFFIWNNTDPTNALTISVSMTYTDEVNPAQLTTASFINFCKIG
jgi:hypothetical protein